MGSRGRKSAADLSVAPVAELKPRHPAPPADLTKEQADEWRAVVSRMPGDWFTREHFAILSERCRHVTRARKLAQLLDGVDLVKAIEDGGLGDFDKLAAAAERETRAILACDRALRLTHQSQQEPKSAFRRKHNRTPSIYEAMGE